MFGISCLFITQPDHQRVHRTPQLRERITRNVMACDAESAVLELFEVLENPRCGHGHGLVLPEH
jgi:hypothetical protein